MERKMKQIMNNETTDPSTDRLAEAELMSRVAARDHKAFDELSEKYSALIFSTAFKVLNHYEDTEDVMSEVLATIWKKAGTYHPKNGSLVTWICTTARTACPLLAACPPRRFPLPFKIPAVIAVVDAMVRIRVPPPLRADVRGLCACSVPWLPCCDARAVLAVRAGCAPCR